jgi:hypothetical protein
MDSFGLGQGKVVGSCNHGNIFSGSIKCGEFLNKLKKCWLFKKDSALWNQSVSWLVTRCRKWLRVAGPKFDSSTGEDYFSWPPFSYLLWSSSNRRSL